ncbi:MAG: hypothetical protein RR382_00350 [Tannerellaceae bacterium]
MCVIASLHDYDFFQALDDAGSLTADEVSTRLGCPLAIATAIVASYKEQRDIATEYARALGRLQLKCYWYNDAATERCSPAKDPWATEDDHPDAHPVVTVPARTVTSDVSKADATRAAGDMAAAQLTCFWVNAPVTVTCQDVNGNPQQVPTDTKPIAPGLPLRHGTIAVIKATVKSYVSQSDADQLAKSLGMETLRCYYFSDEQIMACDSRFSAYQPDGTGPVVADVKLNKPGQTVIVPYGYVVSETSTADANSQALTTAGSLLVCCYKSKALSVECPVLDRFDPDGNPIKVYANEQRSTPSSYYLPEGSYISCVSQEIADKQAQDFISIALHCIYCNGPVMPTCVPEWVTVGVLNGTIDLPLDPERLVDPDTGGPVDFSLWSTDATMGTPADLYCSETYDDAEAGGEVGGTVPVIRTQSACAFGNDKVSVACEAPTATAPLDASVAISKFLPGSWVSNDSYPTVGKWITVNAGTIVATADDTPGALLPTDPNYSKEFNDKLVKDYANKQALDMAWGLTDCFFSNPLTDVICELPDSDWSGRGGKPWTIGMKKPKGLFTDNSHTQTNPLRLSPGMFRSYISLEDVFHQALQFAYNNAICLYCNSKKHADCLTPGAVGNGVIIPECSIVASIEESANKRAQQIADSALVCIKVQPPTPPPSPGEDGKPGAPGSPGAQTNCSGQCFGVYC